MKILVVDDEQVALDSVKRILRRHGIADVQICNNGAAAIEMIKSNDFDVVILDYIMPEVDGMKVLTAAKPYKPATEFIMLTAIDDIGSAVKAVRLGAYDYLAKPTENERLLLTIEQAYKHKGLKAGLAGSSGDSPVKEIPEEFSRIITKDPRLIELVSYTRIMAKGGISVLITGESGTGKELLAEGIHNACSNSAGPFVAVNVSSVPETLFESQFFGHVKGSFTGAVADHKGYFEQADNGSLFLDEIGEFPVNLQSKILRTIEEKSVTRIGETKPKKVNVNIISATNKNLDEACREKTFRIDLLYRLKSAHVHLPPLRERKCDIPLLAGHFLNSAYAGHKKDKPVFSEQATSYLLSPDYPGNVRELEQMIKKAAVLADSGIITPEHLGDSTGIQTAWPLLNNTICSLKENEDEHVVNVLLHTGGDKKKAADILGVSVRQVQRKLLSLRDNPRWTQKLSDI